MMDAKRAQAWLQEVARMIAGIDPGALARASEALWEVCQRQGTIFIAGNGGSASTASHLALDLQKVARAPGGPATRAVALTDNVGLLTAWANDTDFSRVFAAQLEALGRPGDALIVISVSGTSQNILAGLEAARGRGMLTVGLLGGEGGRAAGLVDHAVIVPSQDYGWVESAHVVLHHALAYALREAAVEEAAAARRAEPR